MSMIGSGMITPLGGARVVQLSDSNGVDSLQVKDSDGFVVFKVDSKGIIYTKASKVMRI